MSKAFLGLQSGDPCSRWSIDWLLEPRDCQAEDMSRQYLTPRQNPRTVPRSHRPILAPTFLAKNVSCEHPLLWSTISPTYENEVRIFTFQTWRRGPILKMGDDRQLIRWIHIPFQARIKAFWSCLRPARACLYLRDKPQPTHIYHGVHGQLAISRMIHQVNAFPRFWW